MRGKQRFKLMRTGLQTAKNSWINATQNWDNKWGKATWFISTNYRHHMRTKVHSPESVSKGQHLADTNVLCADRIRTNSYAPLQLPTVCFKCIVLLCSTIFDCSIQNFLFSHGSYGLRPGCARIDVLYLRIFNHLFWPSHVRGIWLWCQYLLPFLGFSNDRLLDIGWQSVGRNISLAHQPRCVHWASNNQPLPCFDSPYDLLRLSTGQYFIILTSLWP